MDSLPLMILEGPPTYKGIRCVNCDDLIECIEGVLWLHTWVEYDLEEKEGLLRRDCMVDAWMDFNGLRDESQEKRLLRIIFAENTKAEPPAGYTLETYDRSRYQSRSPSHRENAERQDQGS